MKRVSGRERRHLRVRRRVFGTAERPRMVIHRSLKNLHVQLVDDLCHRTIISLSTCMPDLKKKAAYGGNVKAAAILGESLAKAAQDKGISNVAFDRSGYKYHGRIKALAESAIKRGLSFREERSGKIDRG